MLERKNKKKFIKKLDDLHQTGYITYIITNKENIMKTLLITEIGLARGYGAEEQHIIQSEEQWRAFVSERIGGWAHSQHTELRENYHTKHHWDTNEQMVEHIGNLWGYYVSQGIDFAKDLWDAFNHSLDYSLDYAFPDGLSET